MRRIGREKLEIRISKLETNIKKKRKLKMFDVPKEHVVLSLW